MQLALVHALLHVKQPEAAAHSDGKQIPEGPPPGIAPPAAAACPACPVCPPVPKHACDVGGTWVDGSGTQVGMAMDGVGACSGSNVGGAWTFTVTVSNTGTVVTLSAGVTGTVAGVAPSPRTIAWSNGITYTEQLPAAR